MPFLTLFGADFSPPKIDYRKKVGANLFYPLHWRTLVETHPKYARCFGRCGSARRSARGSGRRAGRAPHRLAVGARGWLLAFGAFEAPIVWGLTRTAVEEPESPPNRSFKGGRHVLLFVWLDTLQRLVWRKPAPHTRKIHSGRFP